MTTTTLRPNGTASNSAWAATGAASLHAALSDNSDSTYGQPSTNAGDSLRLDLGTFTVPTNSQIRSVTVRVRCSQGTAGTYALDIALVVNGVYGSTNAIMPGTSIETLSSSARTTNPSNGAWTQADLDALQVNLDSNYYTGSGSQPIAYEVYADVLYNEAPVVTVADQADSDGGVAGIQIGTTRPVISWTYSDPDGDAQERARVKIFSAAQYGAGGFDPETSTATYDSGELLQSGTSHTITVDLTNGTTYKAYVKAADVGSSGRYGAWDAATNPFTVSITPPPAPSVTVTVNNTEQRFKIDLAQGGASPATDEFVLERTQDGGTTWSAVRGSPVSNSGGGTKTVYDYEALRGVATQYRARARSVISGNTVVSANTTSGSFTITHDGKAWIKVPEDSTLNRQVSLYGEGVTFEKPEDQGVFSPLSRTRKVVISDAMKGEEFSLAVICQGATTYSDLEAIRNAQKTVLLQDDAGSTQFYLRFVGGRKADLRNLGGRRSGNPLRYWTCDVVEVDAP